MNNFAKTIAFGAVALSANFVTEAQIAPKAQTNSAPRTLSLGTPGQTLQPGPGLNRTLQNLTPEQREKLDAENKSFRDKATPLYARLVTARRELESAVDQDKVNEEAVRLKAKEIADLEADIAVARAQRYAKFRTFLSAEQARLFNQPTPLGRPFQPALHEGQTPPPIAPTK